MHLVIPAKPIRKQYMSWHATTSSTLSVNGKGNASVIVSGFNLWYLTHTHILSFFFRTATIGLSHVDGFTSQINPAFKKFSISFFTRAA